MKEQELEKIIRKILLETQNNDRYNSSSLKNNTVGVKDYPLGQKRQDLLRTPTNKKISEITIENVMNGNITDKDVRITPEVLELQAQVAEDANRHSLAENFRRAAELTSVPDERVLQVYNALRPFRSTKEELYKIADEFENKYNAVINANFIREAADVYEKRNKLRTD